MVCGKADIRLLATVGTETQMSASPICTTLHRDAPDEGVDLRRRNVVELLDSVLDLTLVRLDVDDEHKGVVLLNFLHRRLRVKWPDDALSDLLAPT